MAANDELINAEVLVGRSGVFTPEMSTATVASGEATFPWAELPVGIHGHFGCTNRSVWYCITPTDDGVLTLRKASSSTSTPDTVIMLFTCSTPSAPTFASLTWIAALDDSHLYSLPEGEFILRAGVTYFMQYGPYSSYDPSQYTDAQNAMSWTYTPGILNRWIANDDSWGFVADLGPYLATTWPDIPVRPSNIYELDFVVSMPGTDPLNDWAGAWDVNPFYGTVFRHDATTGVGYEGSAAYTFGSGYYGTYCQHYDQIKCTSPVPSGMHLYLIVYLSSNNYPLQVSPPTQEPYSLIPPTWVDPSLFPPPVPFLPFNDGFNRPNGATLGDPWVGTIGVVDQKAAPVGGTTGLSIVDAGTANVVLTVTA